MDSSVEFVAVDNPHATRLTLHILAAVAEHEREMIAQRTKAALQAAKARGIRLGSNGADRLAPAYRAEAIERARQLAPILAELKSAGMSARQIAAELTARGIATPTGGADGTHRAFYASLAGLACLPKIERLVCRCAIASSLFGHDRAQTFRCSSAAYLVA